MHIINPSEIQQEDIKSVQFPEQVFPLRKFLEWFSDWAA